MGMVELMDVEAGLERVGEAHAVDALVDRLLDQERSHRRKHCDPTRERFRLLGEVVLREDLAHHAELVRLFRVHRIAGEEKLLRLPGTELPGVREVLDAHHAESRPDDVRERRPLGCDDQVAGPHQHEAGGVDGSMDLGDRDFAQVAPPKGVLEEVVPLLQHQVFAADAGAAVDRPGRVGVGSAVLLHCDLRAHVVPRREHLSVAAEDDDADGVVRFGTTERVVELDEHPAVLCVPRVRSVQHDPRDAVVRGRFVGDELIVAHGSLLGSRGSVAARKSTACGGRA